MRRANGPDSRRAICEQNGDPVDDGITAAAAGAAHGLGGQRQGLTAYWAGKPPEIGLLEDGLGGLAGHWRDSELQGARYKVLGSRFEEGRPGAGYHGYQHE